MTSTNDQAGEGSAGGPVAVFGDPLLDPRDELAGGLILPRRRVVFPGVAPEDIIVVSDGHHRRLRAHHGRGGRRLRLLQLLQLLAQQRDLLGAEPPVILDHLGGDARAGDQHLAGAVQTLPAQLDLERRALLAAGGIDKADVRPRLGLRRGAAAGQQAGQAQTAQMNRRISAPLSASESETPNFEPDRGRRPTRRDARSVSRPIAT